MKMELFQKILMQGIRAGDWVGYPIYYCKTQPLGRSFTMQTQISGLSLTMPLPRLSGVGYIEILSADYGLLFEV